MADSRRPDLRVVAPRVKEPAAAAPQPPPAARNRGRKPVLRKLQHPITRAALIDAMRSGVPRAHACRAASISSDVLYDEMARDPELVAQVEEAEGIAVAAAIRTIRGAAEAGQWQAAAWFLERRYPTEFGRRAIVAAIEDEEGSGPVEVVITRPGEGRATA